MAAASGRDTADYSSSIDRLAELEILPDEFAAQFRGIAGFRNVLVHSYLELDLGLLHRILNERLDDFVRFAECIERWLAEIRLT